MHKLFNSLMDVKEGESAFRFKSADGRLWLYGRDEGPQDGPLTVLCMGGLTRNLLDYTHLTKEFDRYRIISVDQRGRGRSEWDSNPANYTPLIQAEDMFALLDQLRIERIALVGTSNGGMMSMLMGAKHPARIAGIVLNDVGPELPAEGLERIRQSLRNRTPVTSWKDAAENAKQAYGVVFPAYSDTEWDAFARRTFLENEEGGIAPAYDPSITDALETMDLTAKLPDMWPLWKAIADIPVLIVRGELSDILPEALLDQMLASHPGAKGVTVANRGHAPMLDEPEALSNLRTFFKDLEITS